MRRGMPKRGNWPQFIPFVPLARKMQRLECRTTMRKMGDDTQRVQFRKEADDARLRGLLSPDALTVSLVSAFAGDRPLFEEERKVLSDMEERRKDLFFTDLLYATTHQFFEIGRASCRERV